MFLGGAYCSCAAQPSRFTAPLLAFRAWRRLDAEDAAPGIRMRVAHLRLDYFLQLEANGLALHLSRLRIQPTKGVELVVIA